MARCFRSKVMGKNGHCSAKYPSGHNSDMGLAGSTGGNSTYVDAVMCHTKVACITAPQQQRVQRADY